MIPPPPRADRLHFMQKPWVENVIPILTSLALHAAIVIVGVLTLSVVQTVSNGKALEEQIVIPEASMSSMTGGVANPGIDDPIRPAAQDNYEENTHPTGWAPDPGENPVAEKAIGSAGDANNFLIGGSDNFRRNSRFNPREGDGFGGGNAKGKLAPFGTLSTGGGMPGPRGKLFDHGGNARTIAFCCDSSGSMIDKFSTLKLELAKAIEGLSPIQQFSIVFFADEKAHVFENGALVNATRENKRKATHWLDDLNTSGTSNPIPGLEIAFKSKPELMYILTDGDFPNNDDVIKKLAALNAGKKTRINTIAFVTNADETNADSFVQFLTTAAAQNGGTFKRVSQDQID